MASQGKAKLRILKNEWEAFRGALAAYAHRLLRDMMGGSGACGRAHVRVVGLHGLNRGFLVMTNIGIFLRRSSTYGLFSIIKSERS